MKVKKRVVLLGITIMIFSLLNGCSRGNTMDMIYNNNSKIASEYDTFGISEDKETIKPGIYNGTMELSGSGTIWKYESNSDIDLEVPYSFTVKSGKAKMVLISPDNTVINLVENTDKSIINQDALLTIPIRKGINRIKLVGYKKADIDIELHMDKGIFQKISF